MDNETCRLPVRGIYQWRRVGTNYHTPKYRALLGNASSVFWGLIISLIINEASNSRFPSAYIVLAIALTYAVYLYAQFRMRYLKRNIQVEINEANYVFDLANNQLLGRNKEFGDLVPLFAPDGFSRVGTRGNKVYLVGRPNLDFLFTVEQELPDCPPAYAYRDFTIELLFSDTLAVKEVATAFEKAYGPPCVEGVI